MATRCTLPLWRSGHWVSQRLLDCSQQSQAKPAYHSGPFTPADLSRLKTKFPYIVIMPQTSFLEFIVGEAKKYPSFRLVMGARVKELVEEDGAVRGVRYEDKGGRHEVRAALTVGADGRGSRVRRLAGIEPIKTSPPMDVLCSICHASP